MPSPLIVKRSITIHAPASKVWEALTRPELVKLYMFNSDVVCDWKVGSDIVFKGELKGKEVIFVKGHITRLEPDKLLEYTCFGPDGGLPDVPSNYTKVTYVLIPEKEDTLVTATQGDFSLIGDGQKRHADATKGWEYALEGLKNVVEGKPDR
jgi:uncharacterized protein YndB with AHSA1/START domain